MPVAIIKISSQFRLLFKWGQILGNYFLSLLQKSLKASTYNAHIFICPAQEQGENEEEVVMMAEQDYQRTDGTGIFIFSTHPE